MKVAVHFRNIEEADMDTLRTYVIRRIHFQLSRFKQSLTAVVVRIGDVNGPKGGADKRCRVTVRGQTVDLVTVDELSPSAYSAAASAIHRLARTIGRQLARGREFRRANAGKGSKRPVAGRLELTASALGGGAESPSHQAHKMGT